MDIEDCCPVAAGILRHMEIADHLHFDALAFRGRWRLECEMSHVIQCCFLIRRSHNACTRYIGIHHEAVVVDHETSFQLNGYAVVFVPNFEGGYGRGFLKLGLAAGQNL